jgi:hypothetical protein
MSFSLARAALAVRLTNLAMPTLPERLPLPPAQTLRAASLWASDPRPELPLVAVEDWRRPASHHRLRWGASEPQGNANRHSRWSGRYVGIDAGSSGATREYPVGQQCPVPQILPLFPKFSGIFGHCRDGPQAGAS